MPNKMLIDATHPEETRVVVLRGNRVEEFDFESASRKHLRGNIYLAKVTRVEPSLQAAFVDYGGNRHGFLAFSEIHPDYYQIPVADRQALIDEEERAHREADAEADNHARRRADQSQARRRQPRIASEPIADHEDSFHEDVHHEDVHHEEGHHEDGHHDGVQHEDARSGDAVHADDVHARAVHPKAVSDDESRGDQAMAAASEQMMPPAAESLSPPAAAVAPISPETALAVAAAGEAPIDLAQLEASSASEPLPRTAGEPMTAQPAAADDDDGTDGEIADADAAHEGDGGDGANVTEVNGAYSGGEDDVIESVGGADAMEEVPERTHRPRVRHYKIQEVIKRRQVMLVQVVKEERGTKGAALTTYLSLAGRYSVLMPNTARGGGISRKITDAQDRRRLKEVAQELEVPEGMGVILRTAGASRTKMEVKRDFEYLLRLWENVRDLTLKSTAPTLVYEEGSLIKRSIRDLYSKDIDEILVGGAEGFKEARDFMRMLMPSHAKNVKPFHDTLPIFARFGIESQLDAMFQPVVQLRSGGYIVINQTEALVAIDVNSGRATREHHIEDTALKTNLEASDEIARQLRLRDLAGLVVIDFIDMDEKRNNRTVERRLKEALKQDRARIQVGHISHFGLLEMSRQRIRSSVLESSTDKCSHCGGTGHVRSVSSVSLQVLRAIEETLLKGATHNVIVRTRTDIALYLLNNKRAHLRTLEERFRITITVTADATISGQVAYAVEKGEQVHSLEQAKAIAAQPIAAVPIVDDAADDEYDAEEPAADEDEAAPEAAASGEAEEQPQDGRGERDGRGRRRRRGRGRRGEARDSAAVPESVAEHAPEHDAGHADEDDGSPAAEGELTAEEHGSASDDQGDGRRRRRGRRGGRRNRRGRNGEWQPASADAAAEFEADEHEPKTGQEEDEAGQPHAIAAAAHEDAEAPSSAVPPSRTLVDEQSRMRAADAPEPSASERPAPRAPVAESPALHAPAPDVAAPPPPAPTPRRRSTVREPAPVAAFGEASPPPLPTAHAAAMELPQPVVISDASTAVSEQPRRSGWWRKR